MEGIESISSPRKKAASYIVCRGSNYHARAALLVDGVGSVPFLRVPIADRQQPLVLGSERGAIYGHAHP